MTHIPSCLTSRATTEKLGRPDWSFVVFTGQVINFMTGLLTSLFLNDTIYYTATSTCPLLLLFLFIKDKNNINKRASEVVWVAMAAQWFTSPRKEDTNEPIIRQIISHEKATTNDHSVFSNFSPVAYEAYSPEETLCTAITHQE